MEALELASDDDMLSCGPGSVCEDGFIVDFGEYDYSIADRRIDRDQPADAGEEAIECDEIVGHSGLQGQSMVSGGLFDEAPIDMIASERDALSVAERSKTQKSKKGKDKKRKRDDRQDELLAAAVARAKKVPRAVATAFRVNNGCVHSICRRLRGVWIFRFLLDKLWESICPQGVDLAYSVSGNPLTPREFVIEKVNGRWLDVLVSSVKSTLTVGYAVITYGPDANGELNEITKLPMITPTCLEPDQYTLEWVLDANGQRRYVPRPIGHLQTACNTDENGQAAFDDYDVFVYFEPTSHGRPQSKAFAALDMMLMVQQLLMEYRIAAHSRNNQPFVVQSREGSAMRGGMPTGEPRHPAFSATTARPDPETGFMPSPTIAMWNGQRALNAETFAAGMRRTQLSMVQQRLVEGALMKTSEEADMTTFEIGDSETGNVTSVSPAQMWQRIVLALPANSEMARVTPPELPVEFISTLRMCISIVCSIFSIPAELILGSVGGGAHVTAVTLAQDQLRTAVLTWRRRLDTMLTRMYWKIFGFEHVMLVADAAGRAYFELTEEDANEVLMNRRVDFSFRTNMLDQAAARSLWKDGVLKPDAYARYTMKEYGLPRADVAVSEPTSDPRSQTAPSKNGRPNTMVRRDKKKKDSTAKGEERIPDVDRRDIER
jgi:hypothetical protein